MNSSISSKLSLYDILAMLIPGALLICWVNIIFCNECLTKVQIDPLIFGILFSAGSYLVGIIYCRFMEWIWKTPICPLLLSLLGFVILACWCRYNIGTVIPCIILLIFPVVCVICIVIKICFCKKDVFLCDVPKLLERNNNEMIKQAYDKISDEISNKKGTNNKSLLKKIINSLTSCKKKKYHGILGSVEHYYQAYAFVAKNTYRNVVHTLESQFAFLRSMFGVILLFLCSLPFTNFVDTNCLCRIALLLFFILIAIPIVMAYIQKKIYEIVWEDYEYLNRVV